VYAFTRSGDTTAQEFALRLGATWAGGSEERPPEGWGEIPPVAQLEGVHLVTEGLITLSRTVERLATTEDVHDLPRTEDGATRLARTLLAADSIHFVIGLAVDSQQAGDGASVPPRKAVVETLMADLEARGKLVSVECM